MKKQIHPMDTLCIKAKEKQVEPIIEYIRNNYSNDDLLPIIPWIIESVSDDDYIIKVYDEIHTIYEAYTNPTIRNWLFVAPLEVAIQAKRPQIVVKICEELLQWSPFVIGSLHAIELACRMRNMQIVDAYIRTRGLDFIKDPEVIAIILQEDHVELMDFCLKLKLDKRMRLSDGRSLYEAAVSDEMRELLDERLVPPSWGDR